MNAPILIKKRKETEMDRTTYLTPHRRAMRLSHVAYSKGAFAVAPARKASTRAKTLHAPETSTLRARAGIVWRAIEGLMVRARPSDVGNAWAKTSYKAVTVRGKIAGARTVVLSAQASAKSAKWSHLVSV